MAQQAIPERIGQVQPDWVGDGAALPSPPACASLVHAGMEVVSNDDHFVGVVEAVGPAGVEVNTGHIFESGLSIACEDVRLIDDECIVLRHSLPMLDELEGPAAGLD